MDINLQPPQPLSSKFQGDSIIAQFDQSLQVIYEALSQLISGGCGGDWPVDLDKNDLITRVYLDDLLSEILGDGDDTISYELDVLLGVV